MSQIPIFPIPVAALRCMCGPGPATFRAWLCERCRRACEDPPPMSMLACRSSICNGFARAARIRQWRSRRDRRRGLQDNCCAGASGPRGLQARTAAVSERLVDIAHAVGGRVIFTYHTPTASCARGTMMLFGETPCDGIIETKRCMACALAGLGMPKLLARAAAQFQARSTRGPLRSRDRQTVVGAAYTGLIASPARSSISSARSITWSRCRNG